MFNQRQRSARDDVGLSPRPGRAGVSSPAAYGAELLRAVPIAHRGLHDLARGIPENSLAAAEAAIAAGCAIEIDVHVTADDTLLVFHDDRLQRACGVDVPVADLTQRTRSGLRLFGTDQIPPTLHELMEVVAGRAPLLVEMKSGLRNRAAVRAICQVISHYNGPLAIQSFDARILVHLRRAGVSVPLGLLAGPGSGSLDVMRRHLSVGLGVLAARPDFIGYDIRGLPDRWVQAAVFLGRRPLLCWTVTCTEQLRLAYRLGANVIFEGLAPDRVREVRRDFR